MRARASTRVSAKASIRLSGQEPGWGLEVRGRGRGHLRLQQQVEGYVDAVGEEQLQLELEEGDAALLPQLLLPRRREQRRDALAHLAHVPLEVAEELQQLGRLLLDELQLLLLAEPAHVALDGLDVHPGRAGLEVLVQPRQQLRVARTIRGIALCTRIELTEVVGLETRRVIALEPQHLLLLEASRLLGLLVRNVVRAVAAVEVLLLPAPAGGGCARGLGVLVLVLVLIIVKLAILPLIVFLLLVVAVRTFQREHLVLLLIVVIVVVIVPVQLQLVPPSDEFVHVIRCGQRRRLHLSLGGALLLLLRLDLGHMALLAHPCEPDGGDGE